MDEMANPAMPMEGAEEEKVEGAEEAPTETAPEGETQM